jgi:geranylgeranyl diphosphate synthase, type I
VTTAERMTGTRSAAELLAWSRTLVEPAMRTVIDTLPGPMRRIAGYHLGWWDDQGHPTGAEGGKAIRPALVLLTAAAVGGAPAAAVPAAVAVELAHNFSLLHDDVMDGDATRRHRATAWSVFGSPAAILAGDVLLSLAFEVLTIATPPPGPANPAAMRTLSTAVLSLLAGQSADMAFEERTDVELPECLRMAEDKTGALLGCACALGALFGGADQDQVERLRGFGEHLGLAFQLVDDLLGIWGDPAVTGKPVYSDLHNRKKSLPVVAALTSGTLAGRELAALYFGADPLSDPELTHAAELIEHAGGRAWTQSHADHQIGEAQRLLWAVESPPRAAAELDALARLITHRDH